MEQNYMEHITRLMDIYEEAQEELMSAQDYGKKMRNASDGETKSMYMSMARQELEHESKLLEAGDRIVRGMPADAHREFMEMVWGNLKKHLHKWRLDIESKMQPA